MEGLIELDTLDYSSNYTKVSLKLKKKKNLATAIEKILHNWDKTY